jgi:hypothetical protein
LKDVGISYDSNRIVGANISKSDMLETKTSHFVQKGIGKHDYQAERAEAG